MLIGCVLYWITGQILEQDLLSAVVKGRCSQNKLIVWEDLKHVRFICFGDLCLENVFSRSEINFLVHDPFKEN